jgi:hypothetical protein
VQRNTALFILCSFLIFFYALSNLSAKQNTTVRPSWIHTGGISQYPADLYITGVGSAQVVYNDTASAQAEADSRAIAQVAKQIEVVINQLSSSFERELSSSAKGSLSQKDVWEKTAAFVKIKIEGVRIENRYFDKENNRIYSLALFDRMAQGEMVSNEISILESNASALILEAEKSKNKIGKAHRSVAAYGLAIKKMLLALRKNQYLSIIAPFLVHRSIPTTLSDLQTDITDFMSQFSFEAIKGDNQKSIISGNLPEPLQLQVLYNGVPVPSMPILFKFVEGSGNIDAYARTDRDGFVSTTVSNLGPTGKKINKILALIDIYPSDLTIQKELSTVIPPVYAQFTYYLPAVEDIKIAVIVNEYNLGNKQTDSYLANRIIQTLSKSKLKIVKDIPEAFMTESFDINGGPEIGAILRQLSSISDIAIVGEVKSTLMDDSFSPSLVFTRARALVKIFDLASSTEIANIDISLKGAGPSREESGLRAIKKVSSIASEKVAREVKRTLFGK